MRSRAWYRGPAQPWSGVNNKKFFQIDLGSKKCWGPTATSGTVSSEKTAVVSSTCRCNACFPGNKVKINSGKHGLLHGVKPLAARPGIRFYFWSVRQQRSRLQSTITTTLPCLSVVVAEREWHITWSGRMRCFHARFVLVPGSLSSGKGMFPPASPCGWSA